MILSDKLLNELHCLEESIFCISQYKNINNTQMEMFLQELEKRRYNILNQLYLHNKTVEYNTDKIQTIRDDYKATVENDILKIYVPEPMPSYKNLKTHAYKNILLNLIEVTKPFSNMFSERVFIYIKIFDNIKGWDVDNKFIKPISDSLIANKIIQDDNIDKMFYCIKGDYSPIPHTEIYVLKDNKVSDFFEELL